VYSFDAPLIDEMRRLLNFGVLVKGVEKGQAVSVLLRKPSGKVNAYRYDYENEDKRHQIRYEPGHNEEQDCVCDDFVSGFFRH
jgi:hypothetical protein